MSKFINFVNGYTLSTVEGSLLILPSISVANVPQLSADLLLHTLSFVKVATLDDEYLHSFVAPVDYVEDANARIPKGISYGLELHYCKARNLTLVQQRSPIIAGFHEDHVDKVVLPLLEQGGFLNVVLFHLLDAGLVENVPPGTLQVYTNEDQLSQSLDSLKISGPGYEPLTRSPEIDTPYMKYLMGKLDSIVKYTVLVAYAYEGDNFYDSLNMASKVAALLDLQIENWKTPVSWFGVYGDKPVSNAMEDGLYG